MDEVDKRDLPLAKKDTLSYLFILIGGLSLLLLIISCSSRNPGDDAPSKTTVDSTGLEAVKIRGVMISVGDSADTVYSQIGMGILTVATNDPADQNNIIIVHSYVTEGNTYRISFCKAMKGYYHVCKISLATLSPSPKKGVGIQSDTERNLNAERHIPRDSINNSQSRSKIFTDDDIKRDK